MSSDHVKRLKGQEGVSAVLDILNKELSLTMALAGNACVHGTFNSFC
jgi:isopentenyl diphosphate isomerase/L-lactate dehydrogenase-like FMN-dependent dehydrogenase